VVLAFTPAQETTSWHMLGHMFPYPSLPEFDSPPPFAF
jgi:hypothetical protein